MIVGWWIESIKSKVLVGSEVILEGIGIKFWGRNINTLVELGAILTSTWWLFMKLVWTLIDGVGC